MFTFQYLRIVLMYEYYLSCFLENCSNVMNCCNNTRLLKNFLNFRNTLTMCQSNYTVLCNVFEE